MSSISVRLLALFSLAFVFLVAPRAEAHKNGIQVFGCGACHRATGMSTVTLTPDRDPILPGDLVTFTATVTYASLKVAGIFVAAPDYGTLGTVTGQGLTLSDGALTHSTPKAAVGNDVTFQFTWQAPPTPGATLIQAFAIAGNGNNQDTGDTPGAGSLEFAYGCAGQHFFFDADRDGYGAMAAPTVLGCADQPPPTNYSARGDDCDDAHDWVHPDAPERCNGKDDNCDGQVDENTTPEMLYPDPDGDGYYGVSPGDPVVGCLPLAGYADQPGDCAPTDATKFPGAPEICNYFDDNCDGRVDEGVRPHCGLGVCEVESPSCSLDNCFPAASRAERCNGLDDNCDGAVDEGDLCDAGSVCLGIHCTAVEGADTSGGSAGTNPNLAGSSTGGGSSASGGVGGSGAEGGSGATQNSGPPSPTLPSGNTTGCGVARRGPGSIGELFLALAVLEVVSRRRFRRRAERAPERAPLLCARARERTRPGGRRARKARTSAHGRGRARARRRASRAARRARA
jgi:hypothetical protein